MLPQLNQRGDLPAGIHKTAWSEVTDRFATGSEARVQALAKLRHLQALAARTGKLRRFLVFGSFVSTVRSPRDVDVALVMAPDFKLEESPRESRTIFSHPEAEARFGASVFWLREQMLPEDLMRDFMDVLQTKRDGTKRGILDIEL